MVLAVCRRVTAHAHDAEDAFQAAFLVLARKADRLGPGDPVGGWLYGVAVRAARKAAARTWRRREQETLVAAVPDVPERTAEPLDPDAARAVAEEVERLPPWYRAAVVLCELEGRSRAAAARELGVAEGTLSSRLAAARKRLAERLAARGFGPAVFAPVAVPPALASAASALGSGDPAPPAVAALAHGVGCAMIPHRIPLASLVLAVVASAALALGPSAGPPTPPPAPPAVRVAADPPKAAPAPRPAPAGPNRIVVSRNWGLIALDPTGKNEATVLPETLRYHTRMFVVSPDGKRVAGPKSSVDGIHDKHPGVWVFIHEGGEGGRLTAVEGEGEGEHTVAWSGDGTQLAVSAVAEGATPKDTTNTHFLYTPATKARTPVKLPDNHVIADWSRDGRFFLTTEFRFGEPRPPTGVWVMNRDGTPRKRLVAANVSWHPSKFSPDGTRVLAARFVAPDEDEKENDRLDNLGLDTRFLRVQLVVIDAATATATPLKDTPLNVDIMGFCWSPDGKRIAYTWRERHPPAADGADRETQSHLTVCDADGGNQLTILTERGHSESVVALSGVDWR